MKITLLTGKTFDLQSAFDFDLKVMSSFKYKRLTLRIDTKNIQAVLTMPKLCSKKKAYEFVLSKQDWVIERLAKIPQTKDFQDGEIFSFLGEDVKICYVEHSNRATYKENNTVFVGGDAVFLHRRVKDYIKKEAKKELLKLSREMADKISCHVEKVQIKDTKSRWGSCSSLNNINYSWRIALAPTEAIKYLVAHEVAHLKHQNHSYAFWKCVKELYPEASIGKKWLKLNGNKLFLYR